MSKKSNLNEVYYEIVVRHNFDPSNNYIKFKKFEFFDSKYIKSEELISFKDYDVSTAEEALLKIFEEIGLGDLYQLPEKCGLICATISTRPHLPTLDISATWLNAEIYLHDPGVYERIVSFCKSKLL